MSRPRPPQRLDDLIAAAVRVFTERGYRRTQMADVARALGVAPGTLYLYVASKEALFDLVIRRTLIDADGEPGEGRPGAKGQRARRASVPGAPTLPLPTPVPGSTLEHLRQRMLRQSKLPSLQAALARTRPGDPRAELTAIVRELYLLIARHRRGIKLLDRSALDWPELASLYSDEVRQPLIDELVTYLRRNRRLRPISNPELAARLLVESIAWFAMHRHGDLRPPEMADDEAAIATITSVLLDGLLKE